MRRFQLYKSFSAAVPKQVSNNASSSDYGLLGKLGQGIWDGPEGLAFDYLTGNMEDMSTSEKFTYGAGVALSTVAFAPLRGLKAAGLVFKGLTKFNAVRKGINAVRLTSKAGIGVATKTMGKASPFWRWLG